MALGPRYLPDYHATLSARGPTLHSRLAHLALRSPSSTFQTRLVLKGRIRGPGLGGPGNLPRNERFGVRSSRFSPRTLQGAIGGTFAMKMAECERQFMDLYIREMHLGQYDSHAHRLSDERGITYGHYTRLEPACMEY